MTEKVEINGLKYEISRNYGDDIWGTIDNLKKMEAIRWYKDNYIYRTKTGEVRACYVDNTSNNWGI